MWVLEVLAPQSENGREVCFSATKPRTLTIGRKGCDVLFPFDHKVSKEHCRLETEAAASAALAVPPAPRLVFVDSSTYGSTVNGQKVHNDSRVLAAGDKLIMGERVIRVSWRPVCLCHSRLKSDERAFVDAIAPKLGVHLTEQLSSAVTHLTMSSVLHTPKLLLALAYRVPVVVPQWLKNLEDALERHGPPPDANAFVPMGASPNKGELQYSVRPERAALFAGYDFRFYAPSAGPSQVGWTAEIVRACGGHAHVLRADGAEALPEAAGTVVQVEPAKGVVLSPAAAHEVEQARADGELVAEETVRTCLIDASLKALKARLGRGAGLSLTQSQQQQQQQYRHDSQARTQAETALLHSQPPESLPAPGSLPAPAAMGPPPPRAPLTAQASVRAPPAARAGAKRAADDEAEPPVHDQPSVEADAPARPAAKRARGDREPGASAAAQRNTTSDLVEPTLAVERAGRARGAAAPSPQADAEEERPERPAAHLARGTVDRAPHTLFAPEPAPEPRPARAALNGDAAPRHAPAGGTAPRAARAVCSGWRSRKTGAGFDGGSFSRSGDEGADAAADDSTGVDVEAAPTTVIPLLSRATNQLAPTRSGKRFLKAPVRSIGQATKKVIPDAPKAAEDDLAIQHELEKEEEYSSRAENLFKSAKNLAVSAPSRATAGTARVIGGA